MVFGEIFAFVIIGLLTLCAVSWSTYALVCCIKDKVDEYRWEHYDRPQKKKTKPKKIIIKYEEK